MKKIIPIIIFLSLLVFNVNSQDYSTSAGPAPVSNIKVTPQEPSPFALGTRYFTQISSSPTFQFGKAFLESCTITNIGAPFTITFPGGLVMRSGIVYTWNQSSPFQLWSIDTITGTHTLVFNMTGVPQVNFTGMCWDGVTMFGVSSSLTQSQIFTVNMTTGACTPIGSASAVCAGAISLLGRGGSNYSLFSLDIVADNLYKWNKISGIAVLVGPLGANINFGQDGCVDPQDFKFFNMTYSTGPQLRIADTATGTLGPVLCTYLNQATGIACVSNASPPPYGWGFTLCRNGLSKAVPDNDPIGIYDTLFVIGYDDCIVIDVNVRIDTFAHSWVNDMLFTLEHNSSSTNLIANRGGSGDNFIGTVLNDSALNHISSGTAPFTGVFRPEQPLTNFNSLAAKGVWRLRMVDNAAGDTGILKAWCISVLVMCPVGGIENIEIPFAYRLEQNFPNPFNPVTTIKYGLPRYGLTSLIIYDLLGRVVAKPVDNEFKDAGTYEVQWPAPGGASGYSSGIYFYTLESGTYQETKKMVLIK